MNVAADICEIAADEAIARRRATSQIVRPSTRPAAPECEPSKYPVLAVTVPAGVPARVPQRRTHCNRNCRGCLSTHSNGQSRYSKKHSACGFPPSSTMQIWRVLPWQFEGSIAINKRMRGLEELPSSSGRSRPREWSLMARRGHRGGSANYSAFGMIADQSHQAVGSDFGATESAIASSSCSLRAASIPHRQEKYRRRSVGCLAIGAET